MSNDEEESDEDIPTFADLVDSIESSEDQPIPDSDSVSDQTASAGGTAAGQTEPDASETDWEWANESGADLTESESEPESVWDLDASTDFDDALTDTEDGFMDTSTAFSGESVISEAKSQAMLELLGDAANILVLGPTETPAEHDVCTTLTTGETPEQTHRILVTTDSSPNERLRLLRGYGSTEYEETVIIGVGDQARSSGTDAETLAGKGLTIDSISNPADLTALGLRINTHLSEDQPTALCFHSLSGLIQSVQTQKVFRFLHVLKGRVQSTGTRAHYHLDPARTDRETIYTIKPIFDFMVEVEEDGTVSIDN